MKDGTEDQSCTRTLSRKKRNCVPPPMQPPGLVVPEAERVSLSPVTTTPSSTAWDVDRLTLKPLSPWVLSHALVGQSPPAGGLVSGRFEAWRWRAPVMTMLSRYQPSSCVVPTQVPISSYDDWQQSYSQTCAIQR